MTSCWVDFNEDQIFGRIHTVTTLRKFCDGDATFGQKVLTWDHDGNTCEAVVIGINGDIISLAFDAPTFRTVDLGGDNK